MNKNFEVEKNVVQFMDEGLQGTSYKDNLRKLLRKPDREIKMDIPVKRDDGSIDTYLAFRVQHSDLMGPYKGGLRFSVTACEEDFRALALLMTLKLSLFDIPFGGAKGGIKVDITELGSEEKRRLLESYIDELGCLVGAGSDIPAPDMGTGPKEMAIISKILKEREGSGVHVTGKPIGKGGIKFRETATGTGVAYATQKAVESWLGKESELNIAIQGFGNVGSVTAENLADKGHKIVAVSDISGGIYKEDGLDIKKIKKLLSKYGDLNTLAKNETEFDPISNETLLQLDVDVLIPAAKEGTVTKENANKINASIVVEGANAPTSALAAKVLSERGIKVVPDIFANAGGVIGSFFEWECNENKLKEASDDLQARLYQMMDNTWEKMVSENNKKGNLRKLAYRLALNNLANRYEKRGYSLAN